MTEENFAAFIRRLEPLAQQQPRWYRLKVVLLAMLGNAYMVLVILATLLFLGAALATLSISTLFGLVALGLCGNFLYRLLKALYVRPPPPQGIPLATQDHPKLFALIHQLQQQLASPAFHQILLTPAMNAAVVQHPRLCGLAGYRNYLLIGMPLLQTLDKDAFKAVLAHEFGHLSRGDGRISNWIYRQRKRWTQLSEMLRKNDRGNWLLQPFLDRYAPYLLAYSFPLSRQDEYLADAVAARLSSPQAMARALCSTDLATHWLDSTYWPAIHQHASTQATPDFYPFRDLPAALLARDGTDDAAIRQQLMAVETGLDDTHPSLADRLAALDQSADFRFPGPHEAAAMLLEPRLDSLLQQLDRQWQQDVAPAWQDQHEHIHRRQQRLAWLRQADSEGRELESEQLQEWAELCEQLEQDAASALIIWRRLQRDFPQQQQWQYHLALRLLHDESQAAEGISLLQALQTHGHGWQAICSEALRDYYWHQGREDEADNWHGQFVYWQGVLDKARAEREHFIFGDPIHIPTVEAPLLASLRQQLRDYPDLAEAWLVAKTVEHLPEQPCYVLCLRHKPRLFYFNEKSQALADSIRQSLQIGHETFVLGLHGPYAALRKRLQALPAIRVI